MINADRDLPPWSENQPFLFLSMASVIPIDCKRLDVGAKSKVNGCFTTDKSCSCAAFKEELDAPVAQRYGGARVYPQMDSGAQPQLSARAGEKARHSDESTWPTAFALPIKTVFTVPC
jgi:hypothetical protein